MIGSPPADALRAPNNGDAMTSSLIHIRSDVADGIAEVSARPSAVRCSPVDAYRDVSEGSRRQLFSLVGRTPDAARGSSRGSMQRSALRAAVLLWLVAALAACSSNDAGEPSRTLGDPSSATFPPFTGAPSASPPPATSGSIGPPEITVTIDEGSYDSVASMASDATAAVIGGVTAVDLLGRPGAAGEPGVDEFVAVTVDVSETLLGDPLDDVVFAWSAFRTDEAGHHIGEYVTNGLPTPRVGDRLVLFLDPVDPAFEAHLGADLTHELVRLDGILFLDGDVIAHGETGSAVVPLLVGRTIQSIRSELPAR